MAADGSVNAVIQDRLISYRLDLLRVEKGVAERLAREFEAALADTVKRYEELAGRIATGKSTDVRQLRRLQELRGELSDALRQLRARLAGQLEEALGEVGRSEATAQASIFRNVGAGFAQIPDAAVVTAINDPVGGVGWQSRISDDLRMAESEIQGVLARGVASGSGMPTVARNLRMLGLIQETYSGRLTAIARTEIQRVANATALAGYMRNSDVVGGVQWLATLDSRTCVVCGSLHNKTWKLSEFATTGRPPPLHPRCRCFLSPVVKSWRELGIPADPRFDGETDAGPDFETWLRRQPRAKQLDVFDGSEEKLGMWRGGLPLDRFTRDFRPLPLSELRRRAGRPANA